jgi:ammonia channel protein AmtB
VLIGAVAGYLVIRGVELPGKLEIDDPVGAFLVYGICGAQAFSAKRHRLGKRFWQLRF